MAKHVIQLRNVQQDILTVTGAYNTDSGSGSALLSNGSRELASQVCKNHRVGTLPIPISPTLCGPDQVPEALMEIDLRQALDRGELQMYYQPLVDSRSYRICGMEALMRWNHPDWGLVSPQHFIPLAESTGLIVPMGEWALRTVCKQIRSWQDQGYSVVRVSVNVSPRQLTHPGLVEAVKDALLDQGVDPSALELELTESDCLSQAADMVADWSILAQLRKLGISVALDDFGAGSASLKYLVDLDLDAVKLDNSFVRNVNSTSNANIVLIHILRMVKRMKLRVVAEGVETAEQLKFLRKYGCRELQGFLFSKPMPALLIQAQWLEPLSAGLG